MSSSEPFLNPETKQTNLCLLCCNNFGKKERSQCLSHDGWPRFKELAFTWSNVAIPVDDAKYYFTELYSKVNDANEAYGRVHKNCRITFRTKSNDYVKKYAGSKIPCSSEWCFIWYFFGRCILPAILLSEVCPSKTIVHSRWIFYFRKRKRCHGRISLKLWIKVIRDISSCEISL